MSSRYTSAEPPPSRRRSRYATRPEPNRRPLVASLRSILAISTNCLHPLDDFLQLQSYGLVLYIKPHTTPPSLVFRETSFIINLEIRQSRTPQTTTMIVVKNANI